METASLSKTVRLSNDEIGSLYRRVHEIVRRVEEGTIPFPEAMSGLQRIIERKQQPETCYMHKAPPLPFEQRRRSERRKSRARLAVRLSHSLQRLKWPERNPERIMAELWEIENIPDPVTNYGRTPVNAILGDGSPSAHDIRVVNSTIQWLGTNIGLSFLRMFLAVSQVRTH